MPPVDPIASAPLQKRQPVGGDEEEAANKDKELSKKDAEITELKLHLHDLLAQMETLELSVDRRVKKASVGGCNELTKKEVWRQDVPMYSTQGAAAPVPAAVPVPGAQQQLRQVHASRQAERAETPDMSRINQALFTCKDEFRQLKELAQADAARCAKQLAEHAAAHTATKEQLQADVKIQLDKADSRLHEAGTALQLAQGESAKLRAQNAALHEELSRMKDENAAAMEKLEALGKENRHMKETLLQFTEQKATQIAEKLDRTAPQTDAPAESLQDAAQWDNYVDGAVGELERLKQDYRQTVGSYELPMTE